MGVRRLEYRHICNGHRYDPSLFGKVFDEAVEVFKRRERGKENYRYSLNDSHPLTLADLREINSYVDRIWADEEIYYED